MVCAVILASKEKTVNDITPNVIIGNPNIRRVTYKITALLGLGVGATQVGFLAAEAGQPLWLTVTIAVYGFLAAGIGFTSASNTPRD